MRNNKWPPWPPPPRPSLFTMLTFGFWNWFTVAAVESGISKMVTPHLINKAACTENIFPCQRFFLFYKVIYKSISDMCRWGDKCFKMSLMGEIHFVNGNANVLIRSYHPPRVKITNSFNTCVLTARRPIKASKILDNIDPLNTHQTKQCSIFHFIVQFKPWQNQCT